MMDADEDGWAMKEIQELIGRFDTLQKNISEKREFFQRVTVKWHQFAEQKHKMNDFFKNTHGIVTKRPVRNAEECKKLIEECKVSKRELEVGLLTLTYIDRSWGIWPFLVKTVVKSLLFSDKIIPEYQEISRFLGI